MNSLHLEPSKNPLNYLQLEQSVGSGTAQEEKIPSATVNIPSLGYIENSQAPEAKDLPNTRWQQSTVGMSL